MSYSDIGHNFSGDLEVKTLRVLNIHHELRIWIQTGAKITIKDYFIIATGVRQAREFWRRGEYSGTIILLCLHYSVLALFQQSCCYTVQRSTVKPDNAFSMGTPTLLAMPVLCPHHG